MSVRVLVGDARAVLAGLPEASVHTCVTSPPYWALRKYGHYQMQLLWGSMAEFTPSRRHPDRWWTRLRWRAAERGGVFSPNGRSWIGALGLEPTIEMYVEHVVEVFRAVRRVLRDDGTLWLNLGDSYASGEIGRKDKGRTSDPQCGRNEKWVGIERQQAHYQTGLPSKNLCMIPARVALALQADGWYLRSDIVWSKLNPMPESVQDRPTRSHEYVFLLSKSVGYYYDSLAIAEPIKQVTIDRLSQPNFDEQTGGPKDPLNGNRSHRKVLSNLKERYDKQGQLGKRTYSGFNKRWEVAEANNEVSASRNTRTVWEVATAPFPEAHFATFPPAIPDRAIRAGTSQRGVCAACLAPWKRVVERERVRVGGTPEIAGRTIAQAGQSRLTSLPARLRIDATRSGMGTPKIETRDWRPTCACTTGDPRPATVLDCFAGAGTTGLAAQRLGRDAILIELNPQYCEIIEKRLEADRLARDPILREQAAARAGGWTAPTLFSLETATGEGL